MRLVRRAATVLVALALLACAARSRSVPPAPVFPMEIAWQASLPDAVEGPLAGEGPRLIVSVRGGGVVALDAATGQALWTHGRRGGAVAAAPGLVALRREDGILTGLDPATGAARFRTRTDVPGTLPPVIDEDRVLVAGQGLAAVEIASGRLLWSLTEPEVTAPPVRWGAYLLVGEADGTLRCRDRATGAALWGYATGSALRAAPAVDARGRAHLGTTAGAFVALKIDDRGQRDWRWKLGADVQSPPALFEDMVLFATFEDVLYALRQSGGNLVWRASLPSRPISGPLLVNGAVLVACHEDELLGFEARTGRRLGAFRAPAPLAGPPLLAEGRVYVALRDRRVLGLALGVTPPEPEPSAAPGSPSPAAFPTARPAASPVPSPAPSPASPSPASHP